MNRRDFLQNRMYYDRVIRKIRDSLEDRVLTTKDAQRIADGITTENGLAAAVIGPAVGIFLERQYGLMRKMIFGNNEKSRMRYVREIKELLYFSTVNSLLL